MPEPDPRAPHVDVGGYLLGTLDRADRDAFAAHLEACPSCRRELAELGRLPGLLAEAPERVEVPAGLEARVMGAIAREPARTPAPPQRRVQREQRQRSVVWRLAWAPAAAAALLLAFAGGLGLGTRLAPGAQGPTPQPVMQTIHLVAANGGTASGDASVRSTAGGRVIELTVRGLPPPPPGHFYTCWLVARDDTLQHQDRVSVGSFVTPNTAPVTLRWETAADLSRYPNLGVTLEPDNGNPLHQGPKVLTSAS